MLTHDTKANRAISKTWQVWVITAIAILFASLCFSVSCLGEERGIADDVRTRMQKDSQMLLGRGHYAEALEAADRLIKEPSQDSILLIWGLRIKVSALGCQGKTDEAVQAVREVIEEHQNDSRIYAGSYKYPVSMVVKAVGYSYLRALYMRNEDFSAAIKACLDEQAAWAECFKWAGEESDVTKQYVTNVTCEMLMADLSRLNNDLSQAATRYRRAIYFASRHPWPKDKKMGAESNDALVMEEGNRLLDECTKWSTAQQLYARNVDHKKQIADIHADAGDMFSNKGHWQRAKQLYDEAASYRSQNKASVPPPSGHTTESIDAALQRGIARCNKALGTLASEGATPEAQ